MPTHKVETITVTLTDSNPQAVLVGCILNIPLETLTMSQMLTCPNPTMDNAEFLITCTVASSSLSSSTSVTLKMNFGGINFIKVFKAACTCTHFTLPGCVDTTLLSIIPVSVLPGNWEYYISLGTNKWVAIHSATIDIDGLTLWFTDDLDRPPSAMNNYACDRC